MAPSVPKLWVQAPEKSDVTLGSLVIITQQQALGGSLSDLGAALSEEVSTVFPSVFSTFTRTLFPIILYSCSH